MITQLVRACFLAGAMPFAALADIPWEEAKERCREENEKLANRPQGHDGTYFVICTLYYTPLESGFTAERGFDMTMEAPPGLSGNQYPRDFLKAVKMEGYGRITTPVNERNYIAYDGNDRFRYAKMACARGTIPLVPRVSAAVRSGQSGLKHEMELATTAPIIEQVFGGPTWKITDTGGGLKRWQLDLYWGEDEPRGPGQAGRPRGTEFEYAYSEVIIIESSK